MKIVDVRATTCDVPVPRPIVMGDLRYDTRDYIVVEVVTDEGVSGFGFGMARYAPIAEVIERNLKPLLIGKDPLMTEQHWDRMYNLNLRLWYLALDKIGPMREAIDEHRRVLAAISRHDGPQAEAAMRAHITSFQNRIRELL